MNRLLMGHCVPTKTTTTAFLSPRSARDQTLPVVSLRANGSTFLPIWLVGVSARARAGCATAARTQAVRADRQREQRASKRMDIPPGGFGASGSPTSTFVGRERFHAGKGAAGLARRDATVGVTP